MHKSHGALQGDHGKGEQVPASINLNGSGASDRSRRTPSDTRAPNGSVNLLKNSRNWECKALYGRRRSSADYRHFISRDLVGDTKFGIRNIRVHSGIYSPPSIMEAGCGAGHLVRGPGMIASPPNWTRAAPFLHVPPQVTRLVSASAVPSAFSKVSPPVSAWRRAAPALSRHARASTVRDLPPPLSPHRRPPAVIFKAVGGGDLRPRSAARSVAIGRPSDYPLEGKR
jgi:hypothetical protein